MNQDLPLSRPAPNPHCDAPPDAGELEQDRDPGEAAPASGRPRGIADAGISYEVDLGAATTSCLGARRGAAQEGRRCEYSLPHRMASAMRLPTLSASTSWA